MLHSGLIHIRYSTKIIISKFCFVNNDLTRTYIKTNNNPYEEFWDEKKIITRGINGVPLIYIDIILNDCYYSDGNDMVILNTNVKIVTSNCVPNTVTFNDIPQLDLGECRGKVKPKPLTATYYFSDSDQFTKTEGFTKTDQFSETSDFTSTNDFTK